MTIAQTKKLKRQIIWSLGVVALLVLAFSVSMFWISLPEEGPTTTGSGDDVPYGYYAVAAALVTGFLIWLWVPNKAKWGGPALGVCAAIVGGWVIITVAPDEDGQLQFDKLKEPFVGKEVTYEDRTRGSRYKPYEPELGRKAEFRVGEGETVFARLPVNYHWVCRSENLRIGNMVYGTDLLRFHNEAGAGRAYILFLAEEDGPCPTGDDRPGDEVVSGM